MIGFNSENLDKDYLLNIAFSQDDILVINSVMKNVGILFKKQNNDRFIDLDLSRVNNAIAAKKGKLILDVDKINSSVINELNEYIFIFRYNYFKLFSLLQDQNNEYKKQQLSFLKKKLSDLDDLYVGLSGLRFSNINATESTKALQDIIVNFKKEVLLKFPQLIVVDEESSDKKLSFLEQIKNIIMYLLLIPVQIFKFISVVLRKEQNQYGAVFNNNTHKSQYFFFNTPTFNLYDKKCDIDLTYFNRPLA